MSGFSGDMLALTRAAAQIRTLGASVPEVAREACRTLSAVLQRQFDEGRDPYGRAWKRLRPSTIARGRHPPPLTNNRDMRDESTVVAFGPNIVMSVPEPSNFHQHGTSRMVARPILPEPTASLPASYAKAIDMAAIDVVRRYERRVA